MNYEDYRKTDLPARLARELETPFWKATMEALRSMNDVSLNLDLPIGMITANGIAIGAIAIGQERVFRNLAALAAADAPDKELPLFPEIAPEDATE